MRPARRAAVALASPSVGGYHRIGGVTVIVCLPNGEARALAACGLFSFRGQAADCSSSASIEAYITRRRRPTFAVFSVPAPINS
jgi:hypothetical protein